VLFSSSLKNKLTLIVALGKLGIFRFWRKHMKRLLTGSILVIILVSGCAPELAPQTMSERQQIGDLSLQIIDGYILDNDETGGIYISSGDGEIGVIMQVAPNSSFVPEMTPNTFGGAYPEEGFPVAMMLFLGFDNISLAQIQTFKFGEYTGFKRNFTATNLTGKMEGEYIFFQFGEQTLIAMGSVISPTGNKQWNPHGKSVFDAIVNSIEFP
jgi:hypothetical protein